MSRLTCFKTYDIRGLVPDELNEHIAYRIGRAYAKVVRPRRVVIGRDIRHSSGALSEALRSGLLDAGTDVYDIGLCGTEEIYFSTFHFGMDGGIMVTASHNPADYNGMKLVREGSLPVGIGTGFSEIREWTERNVVSPGPGHGALHSLHHRADYIDHLLHYVDTAVMKPLRIVINAGNGCAGPIIDLLEGHLPFRFIRIGHEPDGRFPMGVPNPLLPENRGTTAETVIRHGADLGIAWDGDFDRCFFFDEKGRYIEGYYIVGLLAQAMLELNPKARIIHDPRLIWNTIDIVGKAGGTPLQSRTGHAFIKERMRHEDAVYGGEMSCHHYFRNFAYCDSGMIPWLLVTGLICRTGKSLSDLVGQRMALFPASGEINRTVAAPDEAIRRVEDRYRDEADSIDHTDGLSMTFQSWRFNLRSSHTEPVIRLNVESRGNEKLMHDRTAEILALLDRI